MKAVVTAWSGLSTREQVMLIILGVVLIGIGYTLFRYQPAQAHIKQLDTQIAKGKQSLSKMKHPKPPTVKRTKLEKQLAVVEEDLLNAQSRLGPLESKFANLNDDNSIHTLKVDISNLAKSSGVIIRSNQRFEPEAAKTNSPASDSIPLLKNPSSLYDTMIRNNVFSRPLQRLRLSGSFRGLHRFLANLPQLSHRVTIVQFRLETDGQPVDVSQPQPLTSTVILAL